MNTELRCTKGDVSWLPVREYKVPRTKNMAPCTTEGSERPANQSTKHDQTPTFKSFACDTLTGACRTPKQQRSMSEGSLSPPKSWEASSRRVARVAPVGVKIGDADSIHLTSECLLGVALSDRPALHYHQYYSSADHHHCECRTCP